MDRKTGMKRFAAVSLMALAGCTAVQVPDNLKPSAGESLAMIVPANGVQIYECRDGKWAFVAPDAALFDTAGKPIGKHYAGPVWEAADGSKVAGAVQSRADAPSANDIPWLLLSARSVGGEGAFSRVTSIQRVQTVGGVAPKGACAEAGAQARVKYTADYYFFTAR
jgi:hypothetical protein